jgi:hypothetical protein
MSDLSEIADKEYESMLKNWQDMFGPSSKDIFWHGFLSGHGVAEKSVQNLAKAVIAYQNLATCYRIGKRPTEKLFDELVKAELAIAKYQEANK